MIELGRLWSLNVRMVAKLDLGKDSEAQVVGLWYQRSQIGAVLKTFDLLLRLRIVSCCLRKKGGSSYSFGNEARHEGYASFAWKGSLASHRRGVS